MGTSPLPLGSSREPRPLFAARLRSVPAKRTVSFVVYDVDWDNKRFHVARHTGELSPGGTQVAL